MNQRHQNLTNPSPNTGKKPDVPARVGFVTRLRNYFLTGIIVTAPISITIYLSWLFIDYVDSQVKPFIPAAYNPDTYLPFGLPGLGLVIMIIALTLIGALAAGLVGRTLVKMGERVLARMPVVRSIYSALKQIFETVLAQKSKAFREVVLIEFPRKGIWAIGFATGSTKGEVRGVINHEVVNIFMPTAPNPTSGYLLFLPRQDVVFLDMTVEQGLKMVISGGVVTPPDPARGTHKPKEEGAQQPMPETAQR